MPRKALLPSLFSLVWLWRRQHEPRRKRGPRKPLGAESIRRHRNSADVLLCDGDCTRWVGVVLYVSGGVLRLLPLMQLKDRFSGLVAIQQGHALETRGLYRVIHNPSYLGLLVNAVGWALAFRSGVGVLLALSLLVPLVARMKAEERLLREHFGAEYEAYFKRTWRLLPGSY
jgi:protein-S-isoprenylcysteine O-methyltransferase Ste14